MPHLAAGPLIAAGIGGISSIIGGSLAGKPKTQTSTTTPVWTPDMQQLQQQLSQYSSNLMSDPSAGTSAIKTAAQDGINRRYQGMPERIGRDLSSRGYGSSGQFGNSLYKSEVARSGEYSDLESQIAQMILQQRDRGASLSEQLLAMTRGTTSTGTSPSTASSDAFQSAGNGLNNIATLLTLSKYLKNPGGK